MLLEQLPALTWFYGLRPWEIEQLTGDEIEQYLAFLDEYEAEVRRRTEG